MNDLTGAFIHYIETGKNINFLVQGFINAGYSPQDIEQAFNEAKQIIDLNTSLSLGTEKTKENNKKLFLIILILLIFLGALSFAGWYFREELMELFSKIKT